MPEIQKVSVRHDTIMNFMLANPTVPLGVIAAHFGVTQPWLSCIIHSNAFQAQLAKKKEAIFSAVVLPMQEKLMALAHTGVERLHEKMTTVEDPKFIAETTVSILDRLGYSPRSRGTLPEGMVVNQQNNFYAVDKETLANARAAMGRKLELVQAPPPELPLHPGGDSGVGEALPPAALHHEAEGELCEAIRGDCVREEMPGELRREVS